MIDKLRAAAPAPNSWEITGPVYNDKENPDFKEPPVDLWNTPDDEPVYLGDLTYLTQRRYLDKYGRTHTIVPFVPEGILVEKAVAQLLQADGITVAPAKCSAKKSGTWGDADAVVISHMTFEKELRRRVRTAANYVIHAEPKPEGFDGDYGALNFSVKGGQALRFFSTTLAYVVGWHRSVVSIFLRKSRSLPPLHVYQFDRAQVVELARQYDARKTVNK